MKRVYLEITNACNLNCPFCTNLKGHDYLTLQEIDNYTDQIKPYCNYLYLHILGEPTLHPYFDNILDLLDKKGFALQLVTNGTLLNKYPNILNHQCLRKLSISLHSINNSDVDSKYFDTIERLIDINTNTKIELRFYDFNHLDNNLSNYVKHLQTKYNFDPTCKKDSYKLKENTYIYMQELFNWPSIDDPIISYNGKCHGGIDMIAINSKSDVTICCLDPKAYNKIGNLKKDTLEDILNSELYKTYINNFKNNKITSELCAKCSYRLRFSK